MSNYGNRNSKMPDISLKSRENHTERQIAISIAVVIMVLALSVLLYCALDTNHTNDLDTAVSEAKNEKASFQASIEKLSEKEQELITRENNVTKRENAVRKAEAKVKDDQNGLEAEKAAFYEGQLRVYELSKSLYSELAPYYEPDELDYEEE